MIAAEVYLHIHDRLLRTFHIHFDDTKVYEKNFLLDNVWKGNKSKNESFLRFLWELRNTFRYKTRGDLNLHKICQKIFLG